MKPKLVFYSDCPVFGGADVLVAHLLDSPALRERFEPLFVYRSHPAFDAGIAARVAKDARLLPLRFPDRVQLTEALSSWPWPLALIAKAALRLADCILLPYEILLLRSAFRGAEVVHINDGGYPGALGCRAAVLAAKLAGARAVLVVHNLTRPLTLPGDFLDLLVDPLVGRCADVIVTASKLSQESLARRLPREKMTIITDGIPVPGPLRPAVEVRRELGLNETETVWVMTAFFEERKGHKILIEALRRLPEPPKVLLIGDGPEQGAVRALADGLPVSFLGYRRDSADILAACDGLLLPSLHSEDMPLAILDAMALGKPVIASRLAGIPEEVVNGETGLLVAPGDADGLARALSALGDGGKRQAFGAAGRKRFDALFEAGRMTGRYAELYAGLLDGR